MRSGPSARKWGAGSGVSGSVASYSFPMGSTTVTKSFGGFDFGIRSSSTGFKVAAEFSAIGTEARGPERSVSVSAGGFGGSFSVQDDPAAKRTEIGASWGRTGGSIKLSHQTLESVARVFDPSQGPTEW